MTTKYIAILLCILLSDLTVNACDCPNLADFSQLEFNELGVVFTGQVIEQYTDTVIHRAVIKFKVEKLFKGQTENGFVYALNLSDCPIHVERGEYFLLFLYSSEGKPRISKCSRRVKIKDIDRFLLPSWFSIFVHKPDGLDTSYYANNSLASEGKIVNQLQEGYWKYFNKNGNLTISGYYKNGFKDSLWTSYDAGDGNYTVTSFKQDKKHGKTVYYDNNGKIEQEENYFNGLKHGYFYSFYEDGTMSWEARYNMGKKVEYTRYYGNGNKETYQTDTIEVRWYENGNKEYERYFELGNSVHQEYWYKNGQCQIKMAFDENGEEKIFYAAKENGEAMVENGTGNFAMWGKNGMLKDSLKIGIWRVEYGGSDGFVEETNYKKGIKDGTFKRWNKNGNLLFEGAHKDGEPTGIWRFWYINGPIRLERKWLDGENLMLNSWDPEGKPMVINGNGTHVYYNEHGEKEFMSTIEYKNGRER